jgi:hypothetical protein
MANTLAGLIKNAGAGNFVHMRCILVRPSIICEALEIVRKEHPKLKFTSPQPLEFFRLLGEKYGEQQPGVQ